MTCGAYLAPSSINGSGQEMPQDQQWGYPRKESAKNSGHNQRPSNGATREKKVRKFPCTTWWLLLSGIYGIPQLQFKPALELPFHFLNVRNKSYVIQKYDLGRKCLEVLLRKSSCRAKVLTKNATVRKDFNVLKVYTERVFISLSVTAPEDREDICRVLEPYASPIGERIEALQEAHELGLRTYGMLCPCLPGVSDTPEALDDMFRTILEVGARDIWLEPVNPRGPGLKNSEEALRQAGHCREADEMNRIRMKLNIIHAP